MVIFGAGASFDSDPNDPATPTSGGNRGGVRPPLAGNLFWGGYGRFAQLYPACQGLLKRLRAAAPNIEPELERVRFESQRKTFMIRELEAVRYYIRAVIDAVEEEWLGNLRDHVTTYTNLLQEIEEWREERGSEVAFITFNYDCLLDRACRSVVPELKLKGVSDFGQGKAHYVYKLHGSTDWSEEVSLAVDSPISGGGRDYENQLIDLAGYTHPTGRYIRGNERIEGQRFGYSRPAIAIPMVTKSGDDFACPVQHTEHLRQAIPVVSDLVLVGWRGEEQHFHDLWRSTVQWAQKTQLRRLLIVDATKESAEGIATRIRESMDISPGVMVSTVGDGFSAALQSGVFRTFLDNTL
jgi:hypothetical protein